MEKLPGQECPACKAKTLTLLQEELDIPFFGLTFIFSMQCDSCGFKKSDIEAAELKDPCKYEVEIESKDDLNIRVVKSSQAIVKWPDFKLTIEPGINAEGFVANVEKMLNDIYKVLEFNRETEEDKAKKKKLWKLMDKVLDVKEGRDKTKLIIEDPTGNSAIISKKAEKTDLRKAKSKK
ncbi:ZPR1 zinc finger domain-containing protein [Candidatus Woesearchaeota archaeon]|nr:ZPR1 zinc finger domain-containing protein [Candidatus Woesearchaeota archaeon]MBW3017856.1 ZPR1 zinc finger domain-containing protein [Candidatus Woesearchaeota archaeon]